VNEAVCEAPTFIHGVVHDGGADLP
jgi:hypothetical protein